MTNKELDIMDKVAIAAFHAFVTKHEGNAPPIGELSGKAWDAALIFMQDRKKRRAELWEASQGFPL
jgi:hypothetical protein